MGICTGAGILGAICRKGSVCLDVPEGVTTAMYNYSEYVTSIAKEGRATETSSNGVACLSTSSINSWMLVQITLSSIQQTKLIVQLYYL